jgi:hypothetical protein
VAGDDDLGLLGERGTAGKGENKGRERCHAGRLQKKSRAGKPARPAK